MHKWVVSVPVWGDHHTQVFLDMALPALLAAMKKARGLIRVILHTDRPDAFTLKFPNFVDLEFRTIFRKPTYVTLQESHGDTINAADPGDYVILLNADLVVSGNLFTQCYKHLKAGNRAVALLGIRTDPGEATPPVDAAPAALLKWAWARRHRIIKDLEWDGGQSMLPTNLFFVDGASVVARGFHLHPIAIVKHEGIEFVSTIDGDLLECFPRESIHVVTSTTDIAMLEVSPSDKRFPIRGVYLTESNVAASMRIRASELHRWLFTHRIIVKGKCTDTYDEDVVKDILKLMSTPRITRAVPRRHSKVKRHGPIGRVPSNLERR